MLDKDDLQAIAQLMTQQEQRLIQLMAQQEQRFVHMMADQKEQIIHEVKVLIEADVMPKFNLLADGQAAILEKMAPADKLEALEDRVTVLEAVTKKHSRDILELKKAQ